MGESERTIIRRNLEETLESLKARLEKASAGPGLCADLNEYASMVSEHELDSTLRERDLQLIDEIETALDRLADPEFGFCEECGEDIGLARLMARPTAQLCVSCQALAEEGVAA